MANSFQLGGKVALITGSMSGMGLETAKMFLKENLKGIILLDIVEDDSILKELQGISNGADILFRRCDVGDARDLLETYNHSWNSFGYIHLAVHSAGMVHEDDSRKIVCVNVGGVIDGSMWLWNKMRKDAGGEGGTIINISSLNGILGQITLPIYSATKYAVRSFSECLGNSFHYERTGVRVLVVCPGLTDTPMAAPNARRICDGLEDKVQSGMEYLIRVIQKPESVAKVILEIYKNATSGTVWISHRDLPAIQHLHRNEQELIEAYFSK